MYNRHVRISVSLRSDCCTINVPHIALSGWLHVGRRRRARVSDCADQLPTVRRRRDRCGSLDGVDVGIEWRRLASQCDPSVTEVLVSTPSSPLSDVSDRGKTNETNVYTDDIHGSDSTRAAPCRMRRRTTRAPPPHVIRTAVEFDRSTITFDHAFDGTTPLFMIPAGARSWFGHRRICRCVWPSLDLNSSTPAICRRLAAVK